MFDDAGRNGLVIGEDEMFDETEGAIDNDTLILGGIGGIALWAGSKEGVDDTPAGAGGVGSNVNRSRRSQGAKEPSGPGSPLGSSCPFRNRQEQPSAKPTRPPSKPQQTKQSVPSPKSKGPSGPSKGSGGGTPPRASGGGKGGGGMPLSGGVPTPKPKQKQKAPIRPSRLSPQDVQKRKQAGRGGNADKDAWSPADERFIANYIANKERREALAGKGAQDDKLTQSDWDELMAYADKQGDPRGAQKAQNELASFLGLTDEELNAMMRAEEEQEAGFDLFNFGDFDQFAYDEKEKLATGSDIYNELLKRGYTDDEVSSMIDAAPDWWLFNPEAGADYVEEQMLINEFGLGDSEAEMDSDPGWESYNDTEFWDALIFGDPNYTAKEAAGMPIPDDETPEYWEDVIGPADDDYSDLFEMSDDDLFATLGLDPAEYGEVDTDNMTDEEWWQYWFGTETASDEEYDWDQFLWSSEDEEYFTSLEDEYYWPEEEWTDIDEYLYPDEYYYEGDYTDYGADLTYDDWSWFDEDYEFTEQDWVDWLSEDKISYSDVDWLYEDEWYDDEWLYEDDYYEDDYYEDDLSWLDEEYEFTEDDWVEWLSDVDYGYDDDYYFEDDFYDYDYGEYDYGYDEDEYFF